MAWMCPARRPGYTDQWLIPLIKEFAARYDVDAIHHDYVRYPGDLAPDTYCFCDYCLEAIPKYASYYSTAHPDDPLLAPMDRPHLEAHWEKSPKVLPPNWKDYSREMKSRFLLEGSFFPGGNRDLDYFFYEYRAHHVAEFTRAGLRGGAQGASRGSSSRPRSSRTPCRAGASSARTGGASRRGSSTSCRWTTAATTRATSRRTSTCWPRASSSRRPGRATSRTSGPGSRPTSSTTRSGEPLVAAPRAAPRRGQGVAEMQVAFDKVAARLRTLRARAPRRARRLPEASRRAAEALGAKLDAFLAEPAGGLLPAGAAHEDARARARPGRRGRRHLLGRRDHLGPPLEGGGGVLRPVARLVSRHRLERGRIAEGERSCKGSGATSLRAPGVVGVAGLHLGGLADGEDHDLVGVEELPGHALDVGRR